MAVVCKIDEYNTGEVETPDVADLDMGSSDTPNMDPTANPITAGEHGYEKWFKWAFTGIANKVDNLQTWISVGALDAQADLKTTARTTGYVGNPVWANPIATTSTLAVTDYAEADPAAANHGIAGSLTGSLVADGDSDYQIAQYQTTGTHPAGNITQLTLTFQWDEQ